jgi:hypothetical protein
VRLWEAFVHCVCIFTLLDTWLVFVFSSSLRIFETWQEGECVMMMKLCLS